VFLENNTSEFTEIVFKSFSCSLDYMSGVSTSSRRQ